MISLFLNPVLRRPVAVAAALFIGLAAIAAGANAQTAQSALHPTNSAKADTTLHPVRGFLPDLRFKLQGAGGKTVTQDDFKGKTVLLFFGYASCPDVCPTTMAQLSQVMENLGPDAENVRIVSRTKSKNLRDRITKPMRSPTAAGSTCSMDEAVLVSLAPTLNRSRS